LSEGPSAKPTGGPQAHPRRKRGTRGGRHWQSRTAAPVVVLDDGVEDIAIVTAPVARRTRRAPTTVAVVALPREIEYAYIRSDLRRLVIIAAGLFALMLVILVVVER
jgi:predicted phosphoribosyltransferase